MSLLLHQAKYIFVTGINQFMHDSFVQNDR